MSKKDEIEKFVKIPQQEIDGVLYHEAASVAFGIDREVLTADVGGNKVITRLYKLKKYIMIRGKVVSETVVRTEEGSAGRETIKNQMEIEVRKEIKRIDKEIK